MILITVSFKFIYSKNSDFNPNNTEIYWFIPFLIVIYKFLFVYRFNMDILILFLNLVRMQTPPTLSTKNFEQLSKVI
jgi:hypothetical protein